MSEKSPNALSEREWITIMDAAEILQVSRPTMKKIIDNKEVLAFRSGRTFRIDKASIDEYIQRKIEELRK